MQIFLELFVLALLTFLPKLWAYELSIAEVQNQYLEYLIRFKKEIDRLNDPSRVKAFTDTLSVKAPKLFKVVAIYF